MRTDRDAEFIGLFAQLCFSFCATETALLECRVVASQINDMEARLNGCRP